MFLFIDKKIQKIIYSRVASRHLNMHFLGINIGLSQQTFTLKTQHTAYVNACSNFVSQREKIFKKTTSLNEKSLFLFHNSTNLYFEQFFMNRQNDEMSLKFHQNVPLNWKKNSSKRARKNVRKRESKNFLACVIQIIRDTFWLFSDPPPPAPPCDIFKK